MEVFLALDIPPFVMYCVNGKPRSSLFIESTDSMIYTYCRTGFTVDVNKMFTKSFTEHVSISDQSDKGT